ncbi:MAG: LON peptidase substrate-binding domain-containing protein [Pseudobdellovibrionaceae bacterium]
MEVFLFPLINATLFPRTTKPLNVFEPRYLTMIRDAVKSQSPVAIGFIEDASKVAPVKAGEKVPFIREVAGYGYPQIVEERVNGSLLIFLQGLGKLRLGKVIDSQTPYIVCEAQIISENTLVETELKTKVDSLYKILTRWIQVHIQDASQREMFFRTLVQPEEIVSYFASYLVRDYDLQQLILEQNDINQKILFLHRLVESNELTT